MVHVIGMKIIDAIKMNVAAELGLWFENNFIHYFYWSRHVRQVWPKRALDYCKNVRLLEVIYNGLILDSNLKI